MTQEEIKQLQNKLLDMMKIIHRICVEHNIEYYIIGGTTLGSIRHGGFIPWDVDLDIAMVRPHYSKFRDVAKQYLPKEMCYRDFTTEIDFPKPHALVELNESHVIEVKTGHHRKIFIDVFPLDYAPNDKRLQKRQAKKIKIRRLLMRCKILSRSELNGVPPIKKMAFSVFRIFSPFINIDRQNVQMDHIMQMYNTESCAKMYLCSMTSHYAYEKQCMPVSVYGKPVLMAFGDTQLYGPEHAHDYLTKIYGDYMKIPSKKVQDQYMNIFKIVHL